MAEAARPRRHPASALLLLCLSFALSSCMGQEVGSFSWSSLDGQRVRLSSTGPAAEGPEGRMKAGAAPRLYRLDEPRNLPAGEGLEVEFRRNGTGKDGEAPRVVLSFSSNANGSDPFLAQEIALHEDHEFFFLALPSGSPARSLRLSLPEGGAAAKAASAAAGTWTVDLVAIREKPLVLGVERGAASLFLSQGASVFIEDGRQHVRIDSAALASLPASAPALASGQGGEPDGLAPGILVEYGKGGAGSSLDIEADGRRVVRARLRPQGLRTVFPLSILPAGARRLELVLPADVGFVSLKVGWLDARDAELADFGRILRSPPVDPRADYDLYRWDLLPSVLVFDFRDYEVQNRYLRRLAFFVEKIGYKGRLASDAELAGLHAWNAHDYRAEDLAAFFETARASSFPLLPEENALRDLLLGRGVVVEKEGKYAAGSGALISISRESEGYLRTLFLTHESTHALYFVDADYRAFVQGIWAAMPRDEKWFWLVYFGWKTYDVDDSYLMANEYQAYLLQQVPGLVTDYFTKSKPAELLEKHPELTERVEAYMEAWGSSFALRQAALDGWLDAKYGFRAGRASAW